MITALFELIQRLAHKDAAPAEEPMDTIEYILLNAEYEAALSGVSVAVPDLNGVVFVTVEVSDYGFRYQLSDMGSSTDWLVYDDAYTLLNECAQGLR